MSARRFFVEGSRGEGDVVAIGARDAHKMLAVLRLHEGDAVEIVDAAGRAFDARIRAGSGGMSVELIAQLAAEPATALRVDVAQGIPKGSKMDFVVEKATELGAASILPVYTERGVVVDLGPSKLERWRRLAQAAAAQSDRRDVPAIEEPLRFEALLDRFDDYDVVLMPWECADAPPLRDSLPALVEGVRRLLVVVGPEGGFGAAEAERARARGAHLISLGSRILRSETAALAVLSVLAYVVGL